MDIGDSDRPTLPGGSGDYTPDILHEDNHVIAVNKRSAMLTQGDASGQVSLLDHLKRYLKEREHKPGNVYLGMVQRLDKPVSGVVVFAKTSKGAKRISEQIRNRQVLKYYVAVTPSAGGGGAVVEQNIESRWREIRDHLKRRGSRTEVCRRSEPGAQSAVLQMKTVFANAAFSVQLIRLITGRKHQIRAQLSARRMPVHGDRKYGSPATLANGRILLHSYLVKLVHPTRKNDLIINCPLPSYFMSEFTDIERKEIELNISGLGDMISGLPDSFDRQ